MNGRVYDPVVGRFLSVDPVFQFPENTQSLNPYTYVLNSPLSFTDPTGFMTSGTWYQTGYSGPEGALLQGGMRFNPGGMLIADGARLPIASSESRKASGAMGVAGGQSVDTVSIDGQFLSVSPKKGTTAEPYSPDEIASLQGRASTTQGVSGVGMAVDFSGYLSSDADRRNIDNTFGRDDLSDVNPSVEQALRAIWREFRSAYRSMNQAGDNWDREIAKARLSNLTNYANNLTAAGTLFGGFAFGGIARGTRGFSTLQFRTGGALDVHHAKHAAPIGRALGYGAMTKAQYVREANYVVQHGTFVPELNAYVRFLGAEGGANYAVVGVNHSRNAITTFHIKGVSELSSKAPSLGLVP